MSQTKFLNLFALAITAFCLVALPFQAQAKPAKDKAAQAAKEKVILMPMDITVEDRSMTSDMQNAVIQGLQQKYLVYSGEQVLTELKKAADKQNKSTKKTCDETKCLQDVSMAFDNANVAMVHVKQISGGYTLSISILDVLNNETVLANQISCKGCDSFQLLDKLKELVGAPVAVASSPASAPEAPQLKVNQNDPDAVLWAEAQKGNTVEDYQVYLDTYPKGKSVPFAKARIKKLNEAAQAATEQQEQQAWDTAQKDSSEDSYGLYLKGYPTGRFAGLAKVRLDKLKNDVVAKEEASLWNKADSSNDQAAIESYLNRYPAGHHIAAASAKLKAIKEEAAKGPAMVRIPGKNYEIGKYDVTQKEWQTVMGTNPSKFTSCGDTCPVEQVSWNDIQEFLQKLNAKSGRQYRLPNEEEWEYACYGGNKTEYCGGSDPKAVAWYNENSNNTTHPVGQKQANAYGLFDMSGNVWQWMENKYDNEHDGRALRGGSWGYGTGGLRASDRVNVDPTFRYDGGGFRLARTLP